jgi:polyisoprenoid-binding protein YceI
VISVEDLHRRYILRMLLLAAMLAVTAASVAGAHGKLRAARESARAAGSGQALRLDIDSAGSRIWFEADASLGRFQGTALRFTGWAEVPDSTYFYPRGRGEIEIEVASFRTGNGMRDGHLRGDMRADRFPRIRFVADDVVEAALAEVDSLLAGVAAFSDTIPAARVFIEGSLTIRDSTRTVRIPARIRMTGDTLRVRGRLATRFTEFGIKPPSRLLGTVKVKDDIALLFDALFRRVR